MSRIKEINVTPANVQQRMKKAKMILYDIKLSLNSVLQPYLFCFQSRYERYEAKARKGSKPVSTMAAKSM